MHSLRIKKKLLRVLKFLLNQPQTTFFCKDEKKEVFLLYDGHKLLLCAREGKGNKQQQQQQQQQQQRVTPVY